MKAVLKNILKRLPDKWRGRIGFARGYLFPLRRSTSVNGEDLIIEAALLEVFRYNPKAGGVYVDVGAYHPRSCSNTWRLSRYGWSGVAIDITDQKVSGFALVRKNCIPVRAAIGAKDGGEITIYRQPIFLSAIDSADADHLDRQGAPESFAEQVPVRSISSILEEHSIAHVDVLSIDIEGMDYEALLGLGTIRPKIIIIEDATKFPAVDPRLAEWMAGRSYALYARAGVSLIYCSC